MGPPEYISSGYGNTSLYVLPVVGSTTANLKVVDGYYMRDAGQNIVIFGNLLSEREMLK